MKNSKEYKLEQYGTKYTIVLSRRSYGAGNLAITMDCKAEDGLGTWWEPYDTLTTNFPESKAEGSFAYIQKDKYLNFVLQNKLGTETGRELKSGFNTYVEICFEEDIFEQ